MRPRSTRERERARKQSQNDGAFNIRHEMTADIEKTNFKKLFRDIRRHVAAGQKLHQSKRTDTDARFLELFDSLDSLLASVERNAERLTSGAAR